MAHLSLPNSILHVGFGVEGNHKLETLLGSGRAALLFPGEGSVDVSTLPQAPEILVVVDGTWTTVEKVFKDSPILSRLPKVRFQPRVPSRYRIRREPRAECVSTIEAVVHVLGALEGNERGFNGMLNAFEHMVDKQISFISENRGASSRHANRKKKGVRRLPSHELVAQLWPHAVTVSIEANTWPRADASKRRPELIAIAARRLSNGEQFRAFVKPCDPVAPTIEAHAGLRVEDVAQGLPLAEAIGAWNAFLRPDDVLVEWGPYAGDVLLREGGRAVTRFDLAALSRRALGTRAGGVEGVAVTHGWTKTTESRPWMRLSAMRYVLDSLARPAPDRASTSKIASAMGVPKLPPQAAQHP